MSKLLLESDFLAADLRTLWNTQKADDQTEPQGSQDAKESPAATKPAATAANGGGQSPKSNVGDGFYTDLQALFNNKAPATPDAELADDNEATNPDGSAADGQATAAQENGDVTDWGKEFKQQIEANNNMDSEARRSNLEVEEEFFAKFFKATWKDDKLVAKLILLGENLRTAFKSLGFNKNNNPIFAFLSDAYVKQELLAAGLINKSTFVAIYEAVADSLVADSEFDKANDYNIIYCRDFYKKSTSDMKKYLKAQQKTLQLNTEKYTTAQQAQNKKVLFYIEDIKEEADKQRKNLIASLPADTKLPSALDATTKLNDISFVEYYNGDSYSNDDTAAATRMSSAAQTKLLSKLETAPQAFAVLQYLSLAFSSAEAAKALRHDKFRTLSGEAIAKAAADLLPSMPKGRLTEDETKALVQSILGRLDSLP